MGNKCHENSDLRPQTLDCFQKKICIFSKKIYIITRLNSYHLMSYGHTMFIGNRQKEAIYFNIFLGLSLWRRSNSEKLTRFKIAADTLITFAGDFFYRRKRRHRVAIMYVVQIEVSFVSIGCDSDKPEKVNISILSGCFLNHLKSVSRTSSNLCTRSPSTIPALSQSDVFFPKSLSYLASF